MRPRVVLADDHVIVAQGLARLLGESTDLVAMVTDGRELVEAVRRFQPDVVVTDIAMPMMSGLDAMRLLKGEGSRARFIILTAQIEASLAANAIGAGASAYLLKHSAGEELDDAIRAVMAGRTYLTPLITRDVVFALASGPAATAPRLAPRQVEVLRLLAEGKRMKEIAAALNLSVRTVEDHKANLLRTVGVETTAELVRFAIRQGLIED